MTTFAPIHVTGGVLANGVPKRYDRLRRLARSYLSRERADHTLQPTALVHEAYLRIARSRCVDGVEISELLPMAARVMRDVLIDHARRKKAAKRGGGRDREPLDAAYSLYESRAVDLVALHEALTRLAEFDPEAAHIVELRFFGGLSEEDTAGVLGKSPRTVRRSWRAARLWLARELSAE